MVSCNGFPKSGNHALVKACELLGVPADVQHIPYGKPVGEPHLFIVRDPRDVIVSALRFKGLPVTPGMVMTNIRRFCMDAEGRSLGRALADYEPWLNEAHVIRYERLIADEGEHRRIADIIGVPYIEGAHAHLPGHTVTWNEKRSDHRDVWTSEVEAVFREHDGERILNRWGY